MIPIKQNFLNPNKQLWPLLTVYKSKKYWSKSGVFQLEQWFCNSAIYSIFQNTVIKADKSNPRGSVVIFNPRVKDSTKI